LKIPISIDGLKRNANQESVAMKRPRFLPDDFTLALIATVSTASWFPASGRIAVFHAWCKIAA
jgi:hypothetical protein